MWLDRFTGIDELIEGLSGDDVATPLADLECWCCLGAGRDDKCLLTPLLIR
jgi:hypothetical protein